jgi:AraC-like DNA-binding protein
MGIPDKVTRSLLVRLIMKKQASHLRDTSFLKEFAQERKSLWICGTVAVLLTASYLFYFQKDDLQVFPTSKEVNVGFYTDKNDQGNSILYQSSHQDSLFEMTFELKKGFVTPYAGCNLAYKNDEPIDVTGYNRLEIVLSAEHINDLLLFLMTKDPHVKDKNNRLAYRHLNENIELVQGKQKFDLSFKTFATPDWWYTVIGQPKSDFSAPDWSQLKMIAFATGLNPPLNSSCTLKVYSIRFYTDTTWIVVGLVSIQLLVIAVAFFVFHLRRRRKKANASINIHYQAVSIEEKTKSGYNFLDFIHQHFTDPELSLAQITKHTEVSQRFISDTISEKFDCNFKTYVNQIRINEAKRLLKETQLNISEVAYKVGFSSPGSFNRVFKNLTGQTPTDFQNTD